MSTAPDELTSSWRSEMRTARDNFWLDEPYEPNPPLSGEQEADVAIIGGGFTGMAAAYFIKERFPKKRILMLEREFIGFGSSGRNSGIGTTLLGHNITQILKAQGKEKTARLQELSIQSISLLEELIDKHTIDCDFEKNGLLVFAETDRELRLLEEKATAYEQIGARMIWLEKNQARSRVGALNSLAAMYSPDDRMLNPGKFVRGMKRVVQSMGVDVYEHSRCTHIEPGPGITLYTSAGSVRARELVLATNAYSNPLGLFRHKVLPFYVYNIVTEPLTQSQMDAFQWTGRENLYGTKYLFWVLRLTADNRVLFIENDALYFRDINRDYSHRPSEYRSHYRLLVKMFPFLKGVKPTHRWGGRIGMTMDLLPSVGRTGKNRNIYYSMGYNGHGLAFSQLAGRMLADLMSDERSDLTDHMLINKSIWGVPSASISYLGSNGYKLYFKALDRLLDMGK
jgi:glycine/D-amino acid oxidase-like deaminating enzyme